MDSRSWAVPIGAGEERFGEEKFDAGVDGGGQEFGGEEGVGAGYEFAEVFLAEHDVAQDEAFVVQEGRGDAGAFGGGDEEAGPVWGGKGSRIIGDALCRKTSWQPALSLVIPETRSLRSRLIKWV
jgi:hypothetical protein